MNWINLKYVQIAHQFQFNEVSCNKVKILENVFRLKF